MVYLFEVSWEVCNKVGGVHTVIRTKVPHAMQEFGENYFLLGPLLDNNPEFRESDDPLFQRIREPLQQKGLKVKLGRWKVPGEPKVILVNFRDRYDVNKLLYAYWRDFGVDSYAGRWDYIEPILFSTACGEVIETIHQTIVTPQDQAVAHFHDWMMGGGVLHVKKNVPQVGIVFTAHATILGRCMAGLGRDIHRELERINPLEESRTYGVPARHSMETACAREADCLTTVSRVTAEEAAFILGKRPDRVVHSGIDIAQIPDYANLQEESQKTRQFLINLSQNFLQKQMPADTRLWVTSGRYEFGNKGYDVLLESLGELDRRLRQNPAAPPVVALFLLAFVHQGVQESARRRIYEGEQWSPNSPVGLTTHRLHDEHNDPIIKACHRLNLRNAPDNKVHIIFAPAYLDGHDGIFNTPYEHILAGCDLGLFPSFYEPWGYTPLESSAYSVPTVTTDVAGFGDWSGQFTPHDGVAIVPRKGRDRDSTVRELTSIIELHALIDPSRQIELRRNARRIACEADWKNFYQGYLEAYRDVVDRASGRFQHIGAAPATDKGGRVGQPHFRSFTVVSRLPKVLEGLWDLAYNLWWSWNPDARELFSELDSKLWVNTDCNPVQFLNQLPHEVLQVKATDKHFLALYHSVVAQFHAYMDDLTSPVEQSEAITADHPIAYFSMEYGVHECLPIYSGGLGVLAGDHLKSASDLNLPLIAVGLFYRLSYFTQVIDQYGNQQEQYPHLDRSQLPMKALLNEQGAEVRVSVQLPGRTIYCRVWVVQVGRVKLYLLDSDVDGNEPDDRWLTSQLYGGDRRTRIKQEVVLGIGGVRLISELLKIEPAVYHLNEGHCAFLFIERMREFMQRGLSFHEAREAVRSSSVFTTHTPVPAGNESFEMELLVHYLRDYVTQLGINWEQFVELGLESPEAERGLFSMTVLALKMTSKANAVARLHGRVSRDMWKNVWKGVAAEEIPIFHVTNGIHTQTWLSRPMRQLLDKHVGITWGKDEDDDRLWKRVHGIPDEEMWEVKQLQKRKFIERIKSKVAEDLARRGDNPQFIREVIDSLNPEFLTIGFARRFATYKRSSLFLRDWERIKRLVVSQERPVVFIVAGKAHPADQAGKDIIRGIIEASRVAELKGRVIFLENYNMGIGRLLTRGVDIWLNNPLRPHEASGTSGMKVPPNGGINFSILDGWWDEAYEPAVGWEINAGHDFKNREHQDESDNRVMLDMLEQQILPLYYQRNERGYSPGWLAMMKGSMSRLSPRFSTMRMVKEYFALSYVPTAEREKLLKAKDYQDIKALTAWKRQISSRFATVQISRIDISGITSELMEAGGELQIGLTVNRGRLEPEEIQAEFVIGLREGDAFVDKPVNVPFELVKHDRDSGLMEFHLKYRVEESGNYSYAVRVVPVHELLAAPQETGLVCWG